MNGAVNVDVSVCCSDLFISFYCFPSPDACLSSLTGVVYISTFSFNVCINNVCINSHALSDSNICDACALKCEYSKETHSNTFLQIRK